MATFDRDSRIGFIGSGAVGGSLAVALSSQGYPVVAAASRTFASAEGLARRVPGCVAYKTGQEVADNADLVFITVPDDAIGPVSSAISWRKAQGVIHCSGAASLDVFESAVQQGAIAGAAHPLQAFSSVEEGVKNLPGITYGIEGNDEMRAFLRQLALDLKGNPVFLQSEDKPLYHASVVMLGGILIGYAAAASELWKHLGIDRGQALQSLLQIMKGSAANMEAQGIPSAVAGPYARGDIGTIRKHLQAVQSRAPEMLSAYCEVARVGIPFSVEKGTLTPERAEEIRRLLDEFKDKAA